MNNDIKSFFGEGTRLVGRLKFKGVLRFDGKFEGEIESDDILIVGDTGVINAKIKTGSLFNHGTINGDVSAAETISLHAQSRLEGAINTPAFITEEGAIYDGVCTMPERAESARSVKEPASGSGGRSKKASSPIPDYIEKINTTESGKTKSNFTTYLLGAIAAVALVLFFSHRNAEDGMSIMSGTGVRVDHTAHDHKEVATEPVAPPEEDNTVVETKETEPPVATPEPAVEKPEVVKPVVEKPKEPELAVEEPAVEEPSDTLASLKKELEANPEDLALLQKTADLALKSGAEDEAERLFEKYGRLDAESEVAVINKGFAQLEAGYPETAEKIFRQVLAKSPKAYRARLGLAGALGRRGKDKEAAKECLKILEADPLYAPALNRLAWTYAKTGKKLDEAIELSKKSLSISPDTPEYIDTLSEINYKKGDIDEAIKLINKAIKLAPKDSYYKRQLFKFSQSKKR